MIKKIGFLMLFFFQSISFASIGADLDSFFDGIGISSNTTSPNSYQSQAGGFYQGGSLYARNPVKQYQLIQIDLPSYRAGCGGIDIFMGSFSFINSEKLITLGKEVMSNAVAYSVDLMLASTVPEMKDVRDILQDIEQKVNHASINSCETAQSLVGGIWPKTAASQQKICKDQGTIGKKGLFHDYVTARMECSGDGFKSGMEAAKADKDTEKQIVLNKNIVWSILKTKLFLTSDTELAEMMMSLTGTFIFDGEGKVTNIPSLSGSDLLINAILGTNEEITGAYQPKIWRCDGDSDSCLSVKLETVPIPQSSTLNYKVKNIIYGLNDKVKNDIAPTAEEKNFLSLVSLPVMKFLMVLNSTEYASVALDIEDYSALVSEDLLQNYLSNLFEEIENATRGSEFNEDLIKDVQQRIKEAREKINKREPKISKKLNEKLNLINRMMKIEKQVASQLGNDLQ